MVPPSEPFAISYQYVREIDDAAREQAGKVVAAAEARLRACCPDPEFKISTEVDMGVPERVIVEVAERWGADIIVTGSHGHGFWKRAWLGSVSNAIVHQAPCSVLVVRSEG